MMLGLVRAARKLIHSCVNGTSLWLQRKSEIGRFAGIGISDIRGDAPAFLRTIISALELIQRYDPRRFARVRRHICWIVNGTLSHDGGCYYRETRTCRIHFENEAVEKHPELATILYACLLVHEATHGLLRARVRNYSDASEFRLRIE